MSFRSGPASKEIESAKAADTCRQQFDPAIPSRTRRSGWTVRPPCADTGNNQFQKHPENCEPLNRADAVQGVSVRMGFGN